MKVLDPAVTVMLASHMKPRWLPSALDSILAQTRRDLQIIVCDSGAWISRDFDGTDPGPDVKAMAAIYSSCLEHPLIEWVTLDQTWPTPLPERACPYTYVWNRVIEAGLIRGRYLAVFTDDDLYASTFVERMAGYLDEHPDAGAVWCSQDRTSYDPTTASWTPVPPLLPRADAPRCRGEWLDLVDMTQVMFRTSAFDMMPSPPFNEDPDMGACRHADGVFLERLAEVVGVVPNIPDALVTHRYTPESTYN